MGKTIGAILTIGAAVAVNLIPGVGQAISGALIGTFGATIASAITLGITVAGLQSLGGVLGLGPNTPKPGTTESAIKTGPPGVLELE